MKAPLKLLATIVSLISCTLLQVVSSAAISQPVRPTTFPLQRPSIGAEAVAWGSNPYGTITPPAGQAFVSVSAGAYHSLGLKPDGTIVPWGWAQWGQNSVPSDATNIVAIADGNSHSMALRADGTVICWGDPSNGRTIVPPGLSQVVAIATAGGHSMALTKHGTVAVWGWNQYGQTTVPPSATNLVAIAAGYGHSVGLREDGTVVAWGWNSKGQATVPPNLSNVVAIAAGGDVTGESHTLALKSDGTVVGWGSNSRGQTTPPSGLNNVIAIDAGYLHSLALKGDGTVVVWGEDNNGQGNVPVGLRASSISAGGFHNHALLLTTPRTATATAQIVNGFLVGINLVDGGFGYIAPPVVVIRGGGGVGATATAQISNGVVTGFTVTNAGVGYTSNPQIIIASPPFEPYLEIAFSRVKVTMHLNLGVRYQIQASQDLSQWINIGTPFIAESEHVEQEFEIELTGRFFRLIEVSSAP